jgi:hypothetical protein
MKRGYVLIEIYRKEVYRPLPTLQLSRVVAQLLVKVIRSF